MKKILVLACLSVLMGIPVFSQENHLNLAIVAATSGQMDATFASLWKFPFLKGNHPLTSGNNVALKLSTRLLPIGGTITGDANLTVLPFLTFGFGSMVGTGWNYGLFDKVYFAGLGMNKKTNINDPTNSEVIGNGLDGVVWDVHAGAMLQMDLAAIIPGDWNHVLMQYYNRIDYFAYSKAQGDELWYYQNDGMYQNAFRHSYIFFIGYAMPIFIDLVGYQLSGVIPFYNTETGSDVKERGYTLVNSFLVDFKINQQWSIMTIVEVPNSFKDTDTYGYEREWAFGSVRFIANWQIK